MKKIIPIVVVLLLFVGSSVYAQLGIRAGINLANEIKSLKGADIADGFNKENLTGYQLGLVYQFMPKTSGFGGELGVLLSQKGYVFTEEKTITSAILSGYKEINYLEVPFNLRYRIDISFMGLYGYGGLYAGYVLNGKKVSDTEDIEKQVEFKDFVSKIDYGYNFGFGIEFFRKVQLGATWTRGLKEIGAETSSAGKSGSYNQVLSVNLTYLF